MNERGFTIIEIIAVVTILGLLVIITTLAYNAISNSIKQKDFENKKSVIKKETIEFVEKYMKNDTYDPGISNASQTICFTVDYLIHNGIVTSDDQKQEYIKNEATDEEYRRNTVFVAVSYDITNIRLKAETIDEKPIINTNSSHSCSIIK